MNANKQDAGGLPDPVWFNIRKGGHHLILFPAKGDSGVMLDTYMEMVKSAHDDVIEAEPLYTADQLRAYGELCRAAPAGGDVPWRCFHCDEVFTTGEAAALHFGTREYQSPACQIDVAAYREMEALQLRYLDEDADVHRAMYRMQSEHQQALRRAEEDGYAKGVRDAEKDAAPAGSGEVEEALRALCDLTQDADLVNSGIAAKMCEHVGVLCRSAALLRKLQQGADYVMVPREPTEAMMSAWFNGICNDGRTLKIDDDIRAAARQDWAVMIAASQDQDGGRA